MPLISFWIGVIYSVGVPSVLRHIGDSITAVFKQFPILFWGGDSARKPACYRFYRNISVMMDGMLYRGRSLIGLIGGQVRC